MLRGWAERLYLVGVKFGTVGARKADRVLEITTFREEVYAEEHRKPVVTFGRDLRTDLSRRDFTVNAMAIRLPEGEFVDPFGGVKDLAAKRLDTPLDPEVAFSDDPLRMLRAARFAAQLELVPAPRVVRAIEQMHGRLQIVSAERINDELSKLLLSDGPSRGLELVVTSGLAEEFMPELSALRLEQDPVHKHKDVLHHTLAVVEKCEADPDDPTLRLAALLHDVGKPKTREITPDGVSFHHHEIVGARMARERLQALRYPAQVVDDVARLVEMHLRFHGYTEWSDSAVRRYVRDAGPLLDKLNQLTRADCTTQNRFKAKKLEALQDDLEERIGAAGRGGEPPGAPAAARREAGDGAPRRRTRTDRGTRARASDGTPSRTRSDRRGRGLCPARRVVGRRANHPGRPIAPDVPATLDGLTRQEVAERVARGEVNDVPAVPSRTVREIVRANVLTRFNALLGSLLVVILIVGPIQDALFGFVLIANAGVGIFQELRAKRTLDRLAVLTSPHARIVREGRVREQPVNEVVLDDVLELQPGDQIVVDGEVLEAPALEVDESLLTGESEAVTKAAGDEVLSGSFVAAGSGRFRATRVGAEAYAAQLAEQGRRFTLTRSELRTGIDQILRIVTWLLVPTATLVLISQLRSSASVPAALRGAVAATVAMVPEGSCC